MITTWLSSLPLLLTMAVFGWLYAYRRHNVNIVDSLWSLFFLAAAIVYFVRSAETSASTFILLTLVAIWSLRLAIHLSRRNAGKAEDHRYSAMRRRNPRFASQSLVTVFGLQAALAWFISLPLAAAMYAPITVDWFHAIAILLFLIGFYFEALADWQLHRFKQKPENKGKVLDTGVWRYSRHPNYFGEACIWWSFFLFALAAGYPWSVVSPLLMTLLLLKVSGVSLLEKDIQERRPAYRRYQQSTSAFLPWFPRREKVPETKQEAQP